MKSLIMLENRKLSNIIETQTGILASYSYRYFSFLFATFIISFLFTNKVKFY